MSSTPEHDLPPGLRSGGVFVPAPAGPIEFAAFGPLFARPFLLQRDRDISGVSGTGTVADGVLWPDGTASVRWRGEHPSVVFWDRGEESIAHVHGHGGATRVVWADETTDAPSTPVSTCPRTDRHGYHMWPERPERDRFCPGHPAPPVDVVAAMTGDGGNDARTTPDNPATSSDTADNPLREQYAAAMREHYLITNRDEADADGNMPCRCGDWREGGDADEYDWDHHLAEAVLAVRDRRMDQLRRERDLAIAHDRQPYPTAWAYEQACTALRKQREGADGAEATARAARFTEQHWREHFLATGNPAAAHALAMVRSALDGQTDPAELGLPEEQHAAFLATLGNPAPAVLVDADTPKER